MQILQVRTAGCWLTTQFGGRSNQVAKLSTCSPSCPLAAQAVQSLQHVQSVQVVPDVRQGLVRPGCPDSTREEHLLTLRADSHLASPASFDLFSEGDLVESQKTRL